MEEEMAELLRFPGTIVQQTPVGLDDWLWRYGLKSIDLVHVWDHKRQECQKARVGIWRYLYPIPTFITRLFDVVFDFFWQLSLLFGLTSVILFLYYFGGEVMGSRFIVAIILILMLGAAIPAMIVAIFFGLQALPSMDNFWRAGQYWKRETYRDCHRVSVPSKIHSRTEKAIRIPGAVVVVERFAGDPFLLVRRTISGVTEEAYIGAWNTGNPYLDSF